MVKLKRSQIRTIKEAMAYPRGSGYVLDLSNVRIVEYFEDEFEINFNDSKYEANGTSKCNRLLTFVQLEDAATVINVLRSLWDRREGLILRVGGIIDEKQEQETKRDFQNIITNIESELDIPQADALDPYIRDRTLDELIADMERGLKANKPEATLDHLHTYCMKKVTHLLRIRGIECNDKEALHARFGKYRKELLNERNLSSFTDRAFKSAISLFESYNDIRNNHSLAHDNPILEPAEARYVFDTVSAILVFLRAVETGRYEE